MEIEYKNPLYTDFVFNEVIEVIPTWQWQELKVGLETNIITRDDIVEYARFILEEDLENFDIVLELAISNKTDDISPFLHKLVSLEDNQDEQVTMDKWRFAMLLHLYLNREKYKNVYEQIATIGADFNHPEDMNGFIYYMPANGLAMEINWINYLKEQYNRFNVDYILNNKS